MDKTNTCQNCAYWVPDGASPSARKTGTCHFWPPTRSKKVSAITTEQVENPVISDLKVRLSTAESFQTKLESQSKYVFAEYPVKMTYEELQTARLDVEKGLSNIAWLKGQLEKEKSVNPFVLKDINHVHESGVWPITANDEWCGQWNSLTIGDC